MSNASGDSKTQNAQSLQHANPQEEKHGHSRSSEAHHQGGHAHSTHAQDEFVQHIRHLRQAEASAAKLVEEAKAKAAQTEAAAKERCVEIANQASEKAVEEKNAILAKGRAAAEKEVQDILSEARKKAEKLKGSSLAEKDVNALVSGLL